MKVEGGGGGSCPVRCRNQSRSGSGSIRECRSRTTTSCWRLVTMLMVMRRGGRLLMLETRKKEQKAGGGDGRRSSRADQTAPCTCSPGTGVRSLAQKLS